MLIPRTIHIHPFKKTVNGRSRWLARRAYPSKINREGRVGDGLRSEEDYLLGVVEALEVVLPEEAAVGGLAAAAHALAEVQPEVVAPPLVPVDAPPGRHRNLPSPPLSPLAADLLPPRCPPLLPPLVSLLSSSRSPNSLTLYPSVSLTMWPHPTSECLWDFDNMR